MASQNQGTFSFSHISDLIHRARLAADRYTPNIGTMSNFNPMMAAINGATQGDILNNHPLPPQAPSAPMFPMGTDPMTAGGPTPNGPGLPSAPQVAAPPQTASASMPQARPAAEAPQPQPSEAPQPTPDTGFFMRNALMQTDPMTGQLIDPSAAEKVRGPDLISKMMSYLHNKA